MSIVPRLLPALDGRLQRWHCTLLAGVLLSVSG
jgi:hypothetical protein